MRWLVFGNPPHPGAQAPRAAAALGVLAVEVRGKLSFALPEPWLVLPDEKSARVKVAELLGAGAQAVAVPAAELARIPAASPIVEFTLGDDAFTWNGGELPWKGVRSAILYRDEPDADPRARDKEASSRSTQDRLDRAARVVRRVAPSIAGSAIAGMLGGAGREHELKGEPKEVLELHGLGANGRPCRGRALKSEVSYAGLGPLKKPVVLQNWLALIKVVTERAPGILDRRGDKTKVRPTPIAGVRLAKIFEDEPEVAEALAEPGDVLGRFVAWQRS